MLTLNKKISRLSLCSLALLLCLGVVAVGRSEVENMPREIGFPSMRFHSCAEIGAPRGSQFVGLDVLGRIIFSSEGELSAFDGDQWRRISTPRFRSKEDIEAVAQAPDGKLVVGGLGYWGHLEIDRRGRFYAISESDELNAYDITTESFTQIVFSGEDTYIASRRFLVRQREGEQDRIWSVTNLSAVFDFQGRVFVSVESGLHELVGNELVPVPNAEPYRDWDDRIMAAAPWADGTLALFSASRGVVLFDGDRFLDIPDVFERREAPTLAIDMARVSADYWAVTVENRGVIFLDRQARVVLELGRRSDPRLADAGKMAVAVDGSLWVTVADGVAQIYFPSPTTYFDQRLGLPLNYPELSRLGDDLIICSQNRLYKAAYSNFGSIEKFEMLPVLDGADVYSIMQQGEELLMATAKGVHALDAAGNTRMLHPPRGVYRMHRMRFGPENQFALVNPSTLFITKRVNGELHTLHQIPIPGQVTRIADDREGNIWFERGISRIGRVAPREDSYHYTEYGVRDGLTSDQWIPLWYYNDEVCFSSRKGVLRFDSELERFVVAGDINTHIPSELRQLTRPSVASNGDFWIASHEGNIILRKQANGLYQPDNHTLRHLGNIQIDHIDFDNDGVAWLISRKTLVRVDDSPSPQSTNRPEIRLSRITDPVDGRLLHHYRTADDVATIDLPADSPALSIEVSSPQVSHPLGIAFEYRIGDESSAWIPSDSSSITLRRLPEGDYTIAVRATQSSGQKSEPIEIPVKIAHNPLHTRLAFIAYAAFLLLAILAAARIFAIRLRRQKEGYDRKIAQQNKAMREKNIQLHAALIKERELLQQTLTAEEDKATYIQIVSEEIRHPLTAMLKLCDELLLLSSNEKGTDPNIRTIRTSCRTLISTLDTLLLVTETESPDLGTEVKPFLLQEAMREVTALIQSSCTRKGVKLKLTFAPNLPKVIVSDPVLVNQVVTLLLNNALRETKEGSIELSLSHQDQGYGIVRFYFSVKDTGPGIEPNKMDQLFAAFSQNSGNANEALKRRQVALAICKRIVSTLDGNIGVSSQAGHGSTFSFHIDTRAPSTFEKVTLLGVAASDEPSSLQPVRDLGPVASPAAAQSAETIRETASESDDANDAEAYVLVAQADPIQQKVTAMHLRRAGYETMRFASPQDVLQEIKSDRLELVVYAVNPDETAAEERVREIRQAIDDADKKLIVLLPGADPVLEEKVLAAGANACVPLPIKRKTFKAALAK